MLKHNAFDKLQAGVKTASSLTPPVSWLRVHYGSLTGPAGELLEHRDGSISHDCSLSLWNTDSADGVERIRPLNLPFISQKRARKRASASERESLWLQWSAPPAVANSTQTEERVSETKRRRTGEVSVTLVLSTHFLSLNNILSESYSCNLPITALNLAIWSSQFN